MRAPQAVRTLLLLLTSGCLASRETATVAGDGPECSFRSPTTCWTVSGRFPAPRDSLAEPRKERVPEEPPLLASDD